MILPLLALAAAIRFAAWLATPDIRWASDEGSYFRAATLLLHSGTDELFWPPVTGWVIAALRWSLGTDSLAVVRACWVMMDIGCVAAVHVLAVRLAPSIVAAQRTTWFVAAVTLAYACYLPAISHAQFATSETLALLQVLGVLLLVTSEPTAARLTAAGLLTGTLILTRTNLLPVLVLLPVAWRYVPDRRAWLRHATIFITAGALVLTAQLYRTFRLSGEPTLAGNGAYNLYLGNRDMYAEDLDLFNPRATPEQIEFRRQLWANAVGHPSESSAELQRMALTWIREHPGTFARRVVGRLARVFVPKNDVLELIGGERRRSALSPPALALLALANLQWIVILTAGSVGLAVLRHRDAPTARLFGAVIAGAVVLCLIAVSKPRYSFVFDPILMLAGAAVLVDRRQAIAELTTRDRWILGAVLAFLAWGWAAWLIFALTSRGVV